MVSYCLQDELHARMLIFTALPDFFFAHHQSCLFTAVDPTGGPKKSLSKNVHRIMAIELVVKNNKLSYYVAKVFDFSKDFFILRLVMLVQLEEGNVIECPRVENEA